MRRTYQRRVLFAKSIVETTYPHQRVRLISVPGVNERNSTMRIDCTYHAHINGNDIVQESLDILDIMLIVRQRTDNATEESTDIAYAIDQTLTAYSRICDRSGYKSANPLRSALMELHASALQWVNESMGNLNYCIYQWDPARHIYSFELDY